MPKVTGPVSETLIGPAAVGDGREEGPQPDEAVGGEARIGERGLGVEGGVVDDERSVVEHGDPGDAVGGLGDHALATRPGRQRRRRRQPVLVPEDEVDRLGGVVVRQAADGGRQPDGQRYEPIVGHAIAPSPRRRPCYGIATRRTRAQIFGHGRREHRSSGTCSGGGRSPWCG